MGLLFYYKSGQKLIIGWDSFLLHIGTGLLQTGAGSTNRGKFITSRSGITYRGNYDKSMHNSRLQSATL